MNGISFVVTAVRLNRRTRQRTADPQQVHVGTGPESVYANCRTAEQVGQAYEAFANETDERTPEVAQVLHVQTFVPVCSWCPDAADLTAAARGAGFDVTHAMCPACLVRWQADRSQS